MGKTEFYADWSVWHIDVELFVVLMMNVIMILLMVSYDRIIFRIGVGWVVVLSFVY